MATRSANPASQPHGERLPLDVAQRIALGAQGFADPRPSGRIDRRHLRRVFDRIGLIQIDSVNVLARSQELVLFARLGAHPRDLIPAATAAGELFETWAHMASHVPAEHLPMYRFFMARHAADPGQQVGEIVRTRPDFVETIFDIVSDHPVVAADVSQRTGPKGAWWDWDDGKQALEYLFRVGRVGATRRPSDFSKVYDLFERRLSPEILARPALQEHQARRELLLLAARYYGVATADDLADYHHQRLQACVPLIAELVEERRLLPVSVDGWKKPAYLHPNARTPKRIEGCALLSHVNPVVWYKPRTARLFEFETRLEIYTPEPKRIYGYYVLPVLLDGELVGRVDLKADRANSTLLVQATHSELGFPAEEMAGPLSDELRLMRDWLGLDQIDVKPKGNAARILQSVIGSGQNVG